MAEGVQVQRYILRAAVCAVLVQRRAVFLRKPVLVRQLLLTGGSTGIGRWRRISGLSEISRFIVLRQAGLIVKDNLNAAVLASDVYRRGAILSADDPHVPAAASHGQQQCQ